MNLTKKNGKGGFFECLSGLAKKIDDALRFADFSGNRTVGGHLDRCFGICRHSYHYLLFPALVAAITVLGAPEVGWRLLMAFFVFVAVFCLLAAVSLFSIRRGWSIYIDLVFQVIVVLAVAGVVWIAAGKNHYSTGIYVYRNFFILAAALIGVALLVAVVIDICLWKGIPYRDTYHEALTKTELFISRGTVIAPGWGALIRAFLTVVPGAPLQLLLFPAIIVLISPADLMIYLFIAAFVVSYLILLMGGFDARLNYIWLLLQNVLFRGGALMVSLLIIAVAAARLFGVSYITTVFDTAENFVIVLLLASVYILFWWYDYWVNRLVAQELLKLLNEKAVCDAQIPYVIEPDAKKTSVLPDGRVLQIHGSSRFVVIGSSSEDDCPRFQAHDFGDMFELMASSAFPGGKAKLSPQHIKERILDFKYLAALALVIISVAALLCISFGTQKSQLTVHSEAQPTVKLAQLLEDYSHKPDSEPALIVAASGGGTRAALYTASVLEGLAMQGKIRNVILGSGVSGGGAALAYFAGQRPRLIGASAQEGWNNFFQVMSKPFIQDVINGALQWRIVAGDRLGILLSESFENHWKLDPNRNELGDVKDFGIILNTAIAGYFELSPECSSEVSYPNLPFINPEHFFQKKCTKTEKAGGRLILTNLVLEKDFAPSVTGTGGPKGLPAVIHDPATRLEVAAALNANFPPVFSNAAIDLGKKERYWVTDGGAVDNRGIEMPLYALLKALRDRTIADGKNLPAVTVAVIDASAFSNQYSQDRGVGTMMGAGTQYASLVVEEQLRTIRDLYRQKGQEARFKFIYLPMPLCLRESGSFGTHWMLQPNINVDLSKEKSQRIKGHEMADLLRAMYAPEKAETLSSGAKAVLKQAVCDKRWCEGAKKLGLINSNRDCNQTDLCK